MFARMPRYGPVELGTHVTSPRGVAVQLRMSLHFCDSSFQKSISEQRTLNPRVRGSSPWRRTRTDLGFIAPGLFMCPFCPRAGSVLAREIGELARLIAAGELELPIEATFPLDRVEDAYRRLEEGHVLGKIVLLP
jgi:NADPH:quinone reductase-like Zn-dependent oxidoreductase